MIALKKIVLDVLKPHQPDAVYFCRKIAELQDDYRVRLTVQEVDEDTQTLQLEIQGGAIDLEPIESAIIGMGASLHSIDHVEVLNESAGR